MLWQTLKRALPVPSTSSHFTVPTTKPLTSKVLTMASTLTPVKQAVARRRQPIVLSHLRKRRPLIGWFYWRLAKTRLFVSSNILAELWNHALLISTRITSLSHTPASQVHVYIAMCMHGIGKACSKTSLQRCFTITTGKTQNRDSTCIMKCKRKLKRSD